MLQPLDNSQAPVTFDAEVLVLRRNWVTPGIALAFAAAGILYEQVGRPAGPLGYFAAWMGIVFAGVSVARDAYPLVTKTTLRASSTTLDVAGSPTLATDTIAEAKTIPAPKGRALVVLTLRDRSSRTLEMKKDEAITLVRVLGVTAGERRATFALVLPFRTRFFVALVVLGLPWLALVIARSLGNDVRYVAFMALLFDILPLSAVIAWMASLVRGRVVIGADGFSVRWLTRERFVPFTDVQTIRSSGPSRSRPIDTIVVLRSKKKLRLRARDAPVTAAHQGAAHAALHEHLHTALARAQQPPLGADNVAALLGGGSRNGREWLAHLDALVHGGTSRYRVAAPGPDLLARIATDASTATTTRVGAAAALVRAGTGGRETVRVAADGCAEPRLREMLLALSEAEGDDAMVEVLNKATRAP